MSTWWIFDAIPAGIEPRERRRSADSCSRRSWPGIRTTDAGQETGGVRPDILKDMTIPTPERQAEFLATTPNVTVATIRADGLPQLTPNWFLWTGSVFLISVEASTVKVRNLRRDPRIVLCVDDVA